MESQGIKSQENPLKKSLKKKKENTKSCVASETLPHCSPASWSLLLLPLSFRIYAFLHSSPWLCTE